MPLWHYRMKLESNYIIKGKKMGDNNHITAQIYFYVFHHVLPLDIHQESNKHALISDGGCHFSTTDTTLNWELKLIVYFFSLHLLHFLQGIPTLTIQSMAKMGDDDAVCPVPKQNPKSVACKLTQCVV